MSQENVEIVRCIYAAWERGDYSSVEWAHPEIDYVIADGPTPGSWTGVAAMGDAFRDVLGAFEDYHPEAEEFRGLDDERVLVLWHPSGRGKMSGVELAQMRTKGANIFHVRDGKVARLVIYFDRELAFANLDLPSDAAVTE
jgi:ketosteroid isomerase-like protein